MPNMTPRNDPQAHRTYQHELRRRKRQRALRARIHAAMAEARRMKRSKRKGTADLDANMLALGFERVGDDGHVEERFREVTS